jgi:lactoylglutathione lyase
MTRLHVHLKVRDLDQSIAFYAALFAKEPDKREADYAKWMLENPSANIAISTRGDQTGVDHIGLQVETADELEAIADRLKAAGAGALEEKSATCCYARSDKYWALSPDGPKWELYRTFGDAATFGSSPSLASAKPDASPCCAVA